MPVGDDGTARLRLEGCQVAAHSAQVGRAGYLPNIQQIVRIEWHIEHRLEDAINSCRRGNKSISIAIIVLCCIPRHRPDQIQELRRTGMAEGEPKFRPLVHGVVRADDGIGPHHGMPAADEAHGPGLAVHHGRPGPSRHPVERTPDDAPCHVVGLEDDGAAAQPKAAGHRHHADAGYPLVSITNTTAVPAMPFGSSLVLLSSPVSVGSTTTSRGLTVQQRRR